MDAIGKLTAGIAHGFNNLLAAVLGGLGLIERRLPLEEEHKKITAMTRRAAEQGSELVKRLLAFARRQTLQPDSVDISRLSATVTDLLAHTLGGLVQFEWRSDAQVWCAYADSTQLELALMNLIINARDAMPRGGTIVVAARNAEAAAGNTLGLPGGICRPRRLRRLQRHPGRDIRAGHRALLHHQGGRQGTGLGLSMVYGFAHKSGGAIDIDSEVGEGTTVEIWLPRAPAPRAAAAEAPSPAAEPETEARPLRILLVDDHDAVRETTAGC